MPNANEPTGTMDDANQVDSQNNGTQPGDEANSNATGNSLTPAQQATVPQEKYDRIVGQVKALQKKLIDNMRSGMQSPANNQPANGEGNDSEVLDAAFELSESKLRNQLENEILPLYDGTDQQFEGEPALDPKEIAQIRRNPWAYASRASFVHAMKTGDLRPALVDIEQEIANRVEAKSRDNSNNNGKPNVNAGGKQVNPSPAPAAAPASQPQEEDLWNMPMDQLEQRAAKARQDLMSQ